MGMTAHEYLSQYLALESDIKRWKREQGRHRNGLQNWGDINPFPLTATYSDMPRGGGSQLDRMAAAIARAVDGDYLAVEHFSERIAAAKAKQLEIFNAIDAVPAFVRNRRVYWRDVLDCYYMQGMSIEEISEAVTHNPDVSTIRRWINHGLAWIMVPETETMEQSRESAFQQLRLDAQI